MKPRCVYCKGTEDLILDDGPVRVCYPCVKALGAVAEAYFDDVTPAFRRTKTWAWLQDGASGGQTR